MNIEKDTQHIKEQQSRKQHHVQLHTIPPGIGCCIGIDPDVDETGGLICCLVKDGDCTPYCIF